MKESNFELNLLDVDEEKVPAWMKNLVFAWYGIGIVILLVSILARSFDIF
ncbi:MAG: hypothetical protein KAS07_03670 [Candidatus Pacebacteria bacterium]|nr:hypothetical protein [Candidatus Paceibacterota bacterium]